MCKNRHSQNCTNFLNSNYSAVTYNCTSSFIVSGITLILVKCWKTCFITVFGKTEEPILFFCLFFEAGLKRYENTHNKRNLIIMQKWPGCKCDQWVKCEHEQGQQVQKT